ncbi:MAG: heparinase II/III family protein, partial [Pseudomonadota bacterium]
DPMRGEAILAGRWRIGMERVVLPGGEAPWGDTLPSRHFADRLHRFDWLADLLTLNEGGADRARFLLDDWISNFGRFDGFSWRIGCAADRVWNWMRCGAQIFEVGTEAECALRLETLQRQIKHVLTLASSTSDMRAVWRASVIDVAQSISLARGKQLDDALYNLETLCTAHIQPDGGHVSRSPLRGLQTLIDLLTLEDLLQRSDRPVPEFLSRWIQRLAGMVAFFQAGDGALLPFHDGSEARIEAVSAALNATPETPRRFSVAPKSGFQKLQKGDTTLVLDAGLAPDLPFADAAHAGPLSFELYDGEARLVTSCGFSPEVDLDFQAAVRCTSAHSTLILDKEDACRFQLNELSDLLYPLGPEGISSKRLEEADEIWLDAQHGGYKRDFGLLHRRRLFMASDGRRLIGEDSLARPVSVGQTEDEAPIPFAIRFHLHPSVTAMTAGDVIVLTSDLGVTWRFKTSHARARLEKTIYLARGAVENSEQIVLEGLADPNSDGSAPPNAVRWAFLRGRL